MSLGLCALAYAADASRIIVLQSVICCWQAHVMCRDLGELSVLTNSGYRLKWEGRYLPSPAMTEGAAPKLGMCSDMPQLTSLSAICAEL